jgi:hypothetical protein
MTPNNTNARRNIEKVASRVPGNRARDAESVHRELSKSGLASHFGQQTLDVMSNSGGATRRGVHPGAAKPETVYKRRIIENPLSLMLLGEFQIH